ncbi:Heme-binding protein A precursor [Polystyrenella longa]|uniref:Heme-binding protein A n=1 Tax=Polystyrenella longa TaxID=2528007 RepID=A0A518CQJ9_9PLAN|nr:ABC transporter substrate-binding protein [Polystyrenella longa]QDU81480.1 Heme-binding protein A precursor [Polystyrenella longa]
MKSGISIGYFCLIVMLPFLCTGCRPGDDDQIPLTETLRIPMPTAGPKSLDPVQGSTAYENMAASQVYETLFQYKYLKRPFELEPLLLVEMPEVSEDGKVYHFELKQGVFFHDDPCFPNGKGREIVAQDVIYSWKRMADQSQNPKSWWLFENTIVGFDELREEQTARFKAGEPFQYDKPIEGMKVLNDYEFKIILKEPVTRFIWILAMFQTSIVPQEAVTTYKDQFNRHPVGTGPYTLDPDDWRTNQGMTFYKNPNYHLSTYPEEHMPEDEADGLTADAGERLPLTDKLEMSFFVEVQPMWLKFQTGQLDFITVPPDYFNRAYFKRNQELRPDYKEADITSQKVSLLDFVFTGFNMEDEVLGGYTPEKKALRQAISLAIDLNEINNAFYQGTNTVYDGPIPPGMAGYPEGGVVSGSFRGKDLSRARAKLAEAGYPNGKGLPPIEYYVGRSGVSQEQSELLKRQLAQIGIKLNVNLVDFGTLIENVNSKKAPMFSFAWGSDYPDAENNLALFYGPNESPGSNHYNYKNPEYDELYREILSLPPSPERTEKFVLMRDMLLEDVPYIGSMARPRFYLIHPRLENVKATEVFSNWYKYLNINPETPRLVID